MISLKSIFAIARVTFSESVRDRVLYNLLFVGAILFSLTFLTSKLAALNHLRVALDFGFTALSVSGVFLAAMMGSSQINRDFDRRTIVLIWSRPVSRRVYVVGKFLGLVGLITLNQLLLYGILILVALSASGESLTTLNWVSLNTAAFFCWIEACVLAAVSVFFASWTGATLAMLFTFGVFLIGNQFTQLLALANKAQLHTFEWVLRGATLILPSFEYFRLDAPVVYDLPLSFRVVSSTGLYGLLWIFIFLTAASALVVKKEV